MAAFAVTGWKLKVPAEVCFTASAIRYGLAPGNGPLLQQALGRVYRIGGEVK